MALMIFIMFVGNTCRKEFLSLGVFSFYVDLYPINFPAEGFTNL
jgi:hypothetical protein